MTPFYQLKVKDDAADLYIYGDIASDGYKWSSTDVSANDIVQQLKALNTKAINVYINSYGGEVSQGVAIYNALKRHTAKVTTYCDSFACSIASVIFMAGDTRKMYDNSLLMIHNAWTVAQGNAADLEKAAEDLKIINAATKQAYLDAVNITDEELTALLDAETWITPEKALEMGFATEVIASKQETAKASASAQNVIFAQLTHPKAEEQPEEQPEEETPDGDELESVITDIVSRLEKLETAVFNEEQQEEEEETPPAENYMEKFINAIKK